MEKKRQETCSLVCCSGVGSCYCSLSTPRVLVVSRRHEHVGCAALQPLLLRPSSLHQNSRDRERERASEMR